MSFVDNARIEANTTLSENGGKVYLSTGGGALLDLYSIIGGLRHADEGEIRSKWRAAYNDNPTLACNLVLYSRDIRNGGLGERRIGRILLNEMAHIESEIIKRNFQTIADCGRWDDLWKALEGTSVEPEMWGFIASTLEYDIDQMLNEKPCSLLAKWMPSINTSSDYTKHFAKKFCFLVGVSERTYRKSLSALRSYLNVVEKKMSEGEWDSIDFETVPSIAMNKYVATFNRRLKEKFENYKKKAEEGKAKVHAATLYPYNIAMKAIKGESLDEIDELQWKNLPNYVSEEYQVVCLSDVSGSMSVENGQPLATSIGLATYFAQRNKGAYHNLFLTFTDTPRIIELKDDWSVERCFNEALSHCGYSTNLDLAFENLYRIAKISNEAPQALVVISDMEIDYWYTESGNDFCESIVRKWETAYQKIGLHAPKLILWNVESRGNHHLAPCTDNVAYVSGSGVGPFKNLIEYITLNAYEAMVTILTQPAFTWR